jgi:hypothetical protein
MGNMGKKTIGILISMVLVLAFGMNSWAGEKKGRTKQLKKIVQTYYQLTAEGKADEVQKLFTPDTIHYVNGHKVLVGSEHIHKITTQMGTLFTNLRNEIQFISATDDGTVYGLVTHSGTLIDTTAPDFPRRIYYPTAIGPLLIQGQTLEWQAFMRFKFNDEQLITEEWVVNDDLGEFMGGGTVILVDY